VTAGREPSPVNTAGARPDAVDDAPSADAANTPPNARRLNADPPPPCSAMTVLRKGHGAVTPADRRGRPPRPRDHDRREPPCRM